ncbi:SPOR domain-containing protein [Noviherbaspirillum massiliense]|nr:SPOR domain-containing protein [Noviherbaspirillum massiliense]
MGFKQMKKQHGGTLLGIIIGLVIGLGIALVVALAVTKNPMLFPVKSARIEKPAAAAPGQVSDPNKPLYGKAPPKDFIKEPEKTLPPADATAGKGKGNAQQDLLAAVEEQKKANAKPDPKEAIGKAAGGDNKWQYFLQAGAFREQNDAEAVRGKLALLGVDAQITERQSENGTLYRVRIGPFAQLDAMTRVRGKLSENGIDAAVVRTAK